MYVSLGVELFLRCVHASSASLVGFADGDLEDFMFFSWTQWTDAYFGGIFVCLLESVAVVWRRDSTFVDWLISFRSPLGFPIISESV